MGLYLNPGSEKFKMSLNSEIYVDKTKLIAFLNKKVNTQQRYVCVSRPRRFGKSMAADMLTAYYGSKEDTDPLFGKLEIATEENYESYLNQFQVIKLDMQYFMTNTASVREMLAKIDEDVIQELCTSYTEIEYLNDKEIARVMYQIYDTTKHKFIVLIDEWDCVMRRYHKEEDQKLYLDYLRNWFKDQPYIALAYMTGILPIKKYGEHSTLNMFDEYSMVGLPQLAPFFGFEEEEVRTLCERYGMSFEDAREWYDGYHFVKGEGIKRVSWSMYSPKSVVDAMLNEKYDTYWSQTESYEALKEWIRMDFDGLKESIVQMLAGDSISINTRSFQNDMSMFHNKDDVLTLLVHLGYLAYDAENKTVSIPNKEVAAEFIDTIANTEEYGEVFKAIHDSKRLLEALWNMEQDIVAEGVEKVHMQFPAIQYNGENALSCVIELAFYAAKEYYTIFRELPTGVGFADICLVPKAKYMNKPAIIIELKWDKSVTGAIEQIRNKRYPERLNGYKGNMLLCGISYERGHNRIDKKHTCEIEKA